ncbi:MAG: deoxynucleoside kinase [Bacteroidales bacterium]|nr:deoxynucleoside kinase [Bacteroidales bacterium]
MRAESENDYRYIVIEGNIGAGKTSLARMISDTFDARLILERFADNPFLPKFYKDPGRYSFPLELSFLAERYMQLKNETGNIDIFSPFTVADFYFMKSIVFASATLEEDEFKLYRSLFNIIYQSLPKPDLYIYLHVEVPRLLENIALRGREYEAAIDEKYLLEIQKSYFSWFRQNPQHTYLILDINNIDFVNEKEDYSKILETIFEKKHDKGINRAILR